MPASAHSRSELPGYPVTDKAEFLDRLRKEVEELTPYAFIGEAATCEGHSGTMIKTTERYIHLLTPAGVVRLKRPKGPAGAIVPTPLPVPAFGPVTTVDF